MLKTLTTMDHQLQEAVTRHLEWDPSVDATMIGITAKDGIVTLSGYVGTYAEKLAAERVTRTVRGVKAIANELEVRLSQDPIDPDIARSALNALKDRVDVPLGLGVTVRGGHLTLTGTVEWMYQRMAAERAVKYLRGVRGVNNLIALKPRVSPGDIQKSITEALHRIADIDAKRIHVESAGNRVVLTGNVRSWHEKDEAVRAAWAAPGVVAVDSLINVIP